MTILALWIASIRDTPFFWDTVQLGSKHAHFFYENHLRWTILPAKIDSGHPPVFGYYIAWIWTLFGKSLPASHWAMFPFLGGIGALLILLGKQLGGNIWYFWLIPLVFLDPVVAGQSALVGPDIALAFFFLLSVYGILSKKSSTLLLGILGLCAISMRGMMTAGAIFLWYFWANWPSGPGISSLTRKTLIFLPGFGFAAWFICWHYQGTGWIGYHPGSPWAPAFEPASGLSIIKNFAVVGWRWVDFGRVFEWLVLVILLVKFPKPLCAPNEESHLKSLLILFACLLVFLSPSAILYQNLSAHRYFLPGFLCLHLLLFHFLATVEIQFWKKKLILAILALGLGTGNLWIYPTGVSMDWDSTLAHFPYHHLRAEMLELMDTQNIDYSSVGTAFPNINTGENLLLNGDQRSFVPKDWMQNEYMLVSNIFNDFSKSEIERLEEDWSCQHRLEQAGVWMALFKKIDF